MVIDKKTKPKSEIAKDFGINPSTLTIIYKQRSAVIEALEYGDYSPKCKRMRSGNYNEVKGCLLLSQLNFQIILFHVQYMYPLYKR